MNPPRYRQKARPDPVPYSSAHFSDQDERFSNKNYRKLLYSDSDIKADPNLTTQSINGQVSATNN